jgi:hypothetical protein
MLISGYTAIFNCIIDSRMPSISEAPFIIEANSYVSVHGNPPWFLPENRWLFKSGTIILSDNGTMRIEVPSYYYREGIDWVQANEAIYATYAVKDSKGRIVVGRIE